MIFAMLFMVMSMTIKEAVDRRFLALCAERKMALNELAVRAGVTPSTVHGTLKTGRKDMYLTTLKILCDGLGMTIPEFFSDPIFQDLEQEIK